MLVSCVGCAAETPPQDPRATVLFLVNLLGAPDADSRRTAALSLGKIADPTAIPALVAALKDKDPVVREYSAWSLGQMEATLPDEAAVALITALGDPAPEVKRAAGLAFRQVSPRKHFLKLLKQALAISELETRVAIIQALSQFDSPSTYPLFVEALKDSDARVRQAAIAGLGELADRRALSLFRKHLLNDEDEGVRAEAAFRLGKLGGKRDIGLLRKAMESDPTPSVHLWASWAINNILPPSGG